MRYLAVALVLFAACASNRPPVDAWVEEQWKPLVQMVPEPADASPPVCDEALGDLREGAPGLSPAPSEELREAAAGWLNAAESLMFECASDPDVDYTAQHERVLLRQAEVEALLERS